MSAGNGIIESIRLDGVWEFQACEPSRLEFSSLETLLESITLTDQWSNINVPGSWEAQGASPYFEGVGVYRKRFDLPEKTYSLLEESKIYLRFYGISAWADVILNDINIGYHEGIWSPFEFDVTHIIKEKENELIVRVIKPGKKFLPLRESLAGFLPDVCMPFGGIWQPVEVIIKRDTSIEDVYIKTDIHQGKLEVSLDIKKDIKGKGVVEISLYDGENIVVRKHEELYLNSDINNLCFDLKIESPHLWTIDDPYLYRLEINIYNDLGLSDRLTKKIGFREIKTDGSNILINDSPVYIRGILHWGWYPDTISPSPSREKIKEEILRLKETGFNLIKHCLYVPIQEYFDLTDEIGMLVWEELPLWVPHLNEKVKEKVYRQYNEIIRSIRHHPSVIIWTLGCELDKSADYQFLNTIYSMVKGFTDGLVRDNSGSGECYGGLLKENADFYDYHFYTDPHFYKDLLDSFAAQWRKEIPWLFGEFCDNDTIRDIKSLVENYGELPWWIYPKGFGINWDISYHRQIEKMEANNLMDRLPKLVEDSIEKSFLYRKLVLELVRQYKNISGYVITGLRDTPITTSGIFDDFGRLKYEKELINAINSDTVITLQWDNRRSWINGGDRLIKWDRYNYWAKDTIRPHIVVSHFGDDYIKNIKIEWNIEDNERVIGEGEVYTECNLSPGTVDEVLTLEIEAPEVSKVTPITLRIKIYNTCTGVIVGENLWTLWIYPKIPIDAYKNLPIYLIDPSNILGDLKSTRLNINPNISQSEVIVTTKINQDILDYLKEGKRALYIQQAEGSIDIERKPFWRESMHIIERHPITEGFSSKTFCSHQFYSLATDTVFTSKGLDSLVGDSGKWYPIIRRLDARNFDLDEYLVEIRLGKGLIVASTLRFQGGLGDQASNISLNPASEYLLFQILSFLSSRS